MNERENQPNPIPDYLFRAPTGDGSAGYNGYSWNGEVNSIPATFGRIEAGFNGRLKTETEEIIIVHQGLLRIELPYIDPLYPRRPEWDLGEYPVNPGESVTIAAKREFNLRVYDPYPTRKWTDHNDDCIYTCLMPASDTDPALVKDAVRTALSVTL